PRRREALLAGMLALLSLLPPVENWLMDQRIWTQAVYRNLTGQLGAPTRPPILLVQIDDDTLQHLHIAKPMPIDRTLLADLVTQLSTLQAPVVGIDYLLDRPADGDARLHRALTEAVSEHHQWLIFAGKHSKRGEWLT
ncbi:CHASE2 domain-containing protein, partial [Haemophilus parainfluenzae]|uniref:CHASE2 domain-containing protein n=1 Tax=Haemophilus parainfluenzae TaxID=729 RepID=UPI00124BA611